MKGHRFRVAPVALRFGLVLLLSGACVTSMAGAPDGGRVQTGTWGGEHAALTVIDSGAHLEFDCASGDITRPLTTDRDGRLAVDGVFVQEHAGAVRLGEEPERKPARYVGRLSGKTLTFDVVLIDSNETIGSFTLTFGAAPHVRKCR